MILSFLIQFVPKYQKLKYYHILGSQRFDVAFTVVTSRSTTYSSSGSTIAFNTVKTNYGNGFNIGNSRFTAPTAGLYFFSWSLAIHGCYNGQSRLVKNGMTYHQVNCRSTFQQCGATVSMALNRGDQVWVVTASSSVYVYAPYSFFSGWKIN